MTRTTDDRIAPAAPIQAVTRRQALARLGLGASVAYATPILLSLGVARASGASGGGGGGESGGGNEGGHGSGPGNDHSSDSHEGSQDDVAELSSPTSPSGPDDGPDDVSDDDSSGTILFGESGSGQP